MPSVGDWSSEDVLDLTWSDIVTRTAGRAKKESRTRPIVSRPPRLKRSCSIARLALPMVLAPTCAPRGSDASFSAAAADLPLFSSRHTSFAPANASVPSRCLFVCRGAVGAEDDEEEDEEEEEDDEAEDDEDMGSEVESEEEEAEEGVVVVVEEEEEESPSPWASVMSSTSYIMSCRAVMISSSSPPRPPTMKLSSARTSIRVPLSSSICMTCL